MVKYVIVIYILHDTKTKVVGIVILDPGACPTHITAHLPFIQYYYSPTEGPLNSVGRCH